MGFSKGNMFFLITDVLLMEASSDSEKYPLCGMEWLVRQKPTLAHASNGN